MTDFLFAHWPWVAAGACLVLLMLLFNRLVGVKNQVEFAFASIDTQLKQRVDLIPNLIATCEKYMGYEQQVLRDLARARGLSAGAGDPVAADRTLSGGLHALFALAENYPELKAAESFALLQRSLNEIEAQLVASRRAFNAAVTDYNNALGMFPTNLLARALGYRPRAWFEIPAEEREPVKVWR